LRLVAMHQGKTVPTEGDMILFGHNREGQVPDAWIGSRATPSPCRSWRKQSPLCRSIPGMAPPSARWDAPTAGGRSRPGLATPFAGDRVLRISQHDPHGRVEVRRLGMPQGPERECCRTAECSAARRRCRQSPRES
jgi:hypothetical protein